MGRDPRRARGAGLPRALAPGRADARPHDTRAGVAACAAAPTCSPTPTRPTSCSSRRAPRSGPRSARATCSPRRASRLASSRCRAGSCSRPQDADYREDVLPAGVPKISRRGRRDVRLVALGRRLDRDRPLRRVGQGRRGARALRHQPRGGRRARRRDDRRARASRNVRVRVGFTPAEEVAAPARHRRSTCFARRRRSARRSRPGYERVVCVAEVEDARALAPATRRRSRASAQRADRRLRLRQLAARVPRARRRTRRSC